MGYINSSLHKYGTKHDDRTRLQKSEIELWDNILLHVYNMVSGVKKYVRMKYSQVKVNAELKTVKPLLF